MLELHHRKTSSFYVATAKSHWCHHSMAHLYQGFTSDGVIPTATVALNNSRPLSIISNIWTPLCQDRHFRLMSPRCRVYSWKQISTWKATVQCCTEVELLSEPVRSNTSSSLSVSTQSYPSSSSYTGTRGTSKLFLVSWIKHGFLCVPLWMSSNSPCIQGKGCTSKLCSDQGQLQNVVVFALVYR